MSIHLCGPCVNGAGGTQRLGSTAAASAIAIHIAPLHSNDLVCGFGFGNESLTRDKQIAFNAGSHNELIRLAYEDFASLVEPRVVRFAAAKAA